MEKWRKVKRFFTYHPDLFNPRIDPEKIRLIKPIYTSWLSKPSSVFLFS